MARVLVTGAEGFTGRYLLQRLARDGHEIHALVHRPCGDLPVAPHAVHVADLRDWPAVAQVVATARPQRVVHLAAIAFVAHDDPAELYATNILGTRNLLRALANCAHPPDVVLLASSAAVYGNRRPGVLSESDVPDPANDYGFTKYAMEGLANLYRDRLPIVIVRPFNYTGRGQDERFLVPKIIAHARARKPAIRLGNLDVARDFSDVRFVVDCYVRLLNTPASIGCCFNICSGHTRSLAELLEDVERLSGHTMLVEVDPSLVRADEVKCLWGSPAALGEVLGALEMPALDQTLRWMLDA